MPSADDWSMWERQFETFLLGSASSFDAAHDLEHVRRVVANARRLAVEEHANLAIVLPAAWLHDCVNIPKDSPLRSRASRLAAESAVRFLHSAKYPEAHLDAIAHAIEAHSFSAKIAPETVEARVVQDADRLDALGAIGLARCLALGGALGRRLYDPAEPFPTTRLPDDHINTIDHFYTKLFRLGESMTTAAGRAEAERRTAFLHAFVEQLRSELDVRFIAREPQE